MIALVLFLVDKFEKTRQMAFETGGQVVEHQIVGFASAGGGGIDLEHEGVKSLGA